MARRGAYNRHDRNFKKQQNIEVYNIRKELNMTQVEIAKKLHMSRSAYALIESGHRNGSYDFYKLLEELKNGRS